MPSRVRTRGGLIRGFRNNAEWWHITSQGVKSVTNPSTSEYGKDTNGHSESMTDVFGTGWSHPLHGFRSGRIFNHPMSQRKMTASGGDSGWKVSLVVPDGRQWHGEFPLNVVRHSLGNAPERAVSERLLSDLTTLASTQAHASVKEPAAYMGVFLGEMKETLSMLRSPLKGLTDFIRDRRKWERYRGRKPKGSTRNQQARNRTTRESLSDGVKAASDCWLEARLGWRPFLLEADAIMNELANGDFSERQTARGQSSASESGQTSGWRNCYGVEVYCVESSEVKCSVRTGILYEARVTPQQRFGLTWEAIPVSAWELIPFSFVVDWFVNVGDYIQAMTPKLGVKHLAGWTTVHTVCNSERVSSNARFYTDWTVQRSPNGRDTAEYETRYRVPWVNPPELVMTLDLGRALRNNRVFDLLSLFTQTYMTGKPRFVR